MSSGIIALQGGEDVNDELSLQFQRAMDIHRFELPTDTVDAAAYDAQDVQIPLVFGLSDNRWLDARVVGTPALAL